MQLLRLLDLQLIHNLVQFRRVLKFDGLDLAHDVLAEVVVALLHVRRKFLEGKLHVHFEWSYLHLGLGAGDVGLLPGGLGITHADILAS